MFKKQLVLLGFAVPLCLLALAAAAPVHAVPVSGKQASPPRFFQIAGPLAAPLQALTGNGTDTSQNAKPAEEEANLEPQETFGTKALGWLINTYGALREGIGQTADSFVVLSQLSSWFQQQTGNPRLQGYWHEIGRNLVSAVGPALLFAVLLELLFFPARRNLAARKPARFTGRLAMASGLFGLRLLPVILFLGLSFTFLNWSDQHKFVHFVVLSVVYALALNRLVVVGWRFLFAPRVDCMRFVPLQAPQALYAYNWLCAFTLLLVYGYFSMDIARGIRVPPQAIAAFGNLLGLAFVIMAVTVVVQKRAFVSVFLRRGLSAARDDLTLLQGLRLWFARRWHILAIAYLVIGYLITALGVENGVTLMLRGTILTLLVLIVVQWPLHLLDRWSSRITSGPGMHRTLLRLPFHVMIWLTAFVCVAASWGVDILGFVATPLGQRLTGSALSIGLTIMAVVVLYEIFSAAIERHLSRRDAESNEFRASARTRTLLPMIRNAALIVFATIVAFVVLSEIGVNVGALLAGAGIIGVAVGFGSQAFVKDLLTGLFIAVDQTIAVGDIVKIGDDAGVVEKMTMRNIHLRDLEGAVHILPFSEVTRVINMTKDFSYALLDVEVAYDSDLEHVMDVLRAVGGEMQQDTLFKHAILQPIEVLGVEKLGNYSITVRSRIRTRPAKQWDVKRMFLLRIKQRFDKEGITIPFPTQIEIKKE